jgi:RsiW-degrading membrane proteinase PrsW (M82 family)
MDKTNYYIIYKERRTGPFPKQKVLSLHADGKIDGDARISSDRTVWIELSLHPDFNREISGGSGADEENEPSSLIASGEEEKSPWQVYRDGKIYGPYSVKELEEMASSDQLLPSDNVARCGDKDWVPAESLIEFQDANRSSAPQPTDRRGTPSDDPCTRTEVTSQFQIPSLMPVGKIFSKEMLKNDFVQIVIFFSIVPFLILIFFSERGTSLAIAEIALCSWATYFCLLWACVFGLFAKPRRQVWSKGVVCAMVTAGIGLPLLFYVQRKMPLISELYLNVLSEESQDLLRKEPVKILLSYVFGVGLCEEFFKIIPLLLISKREKISQTEFMFIGMLSGFGFAIAENVQYSHIFSIHPLSIRATSETELMNNLMLSYSSSLSGQLLRYLSLPILHAAWSGILGWFVAASRLYYERRWRIFLTGLLVVAILHGIYDFLCSFPHWHVGLAAVTIVVLCAYMKHTEDGSIDISAKIKFSS